MSTVNVICQLAESDGVKPWKQLAPDDCAKAIGRVPMKRIGQTMHFDGGIGCFR